MPSTDSERRPGTGRYLPVPASRAFIIDFLHFAARVPSQPLVKEFDLKQVAQLREKIQPRIGWTAIFVKAFALMAVRHPELRCRFAPWPWARLYQQPEQRAHICISRHHAGEDWLFFHGIPRPEERSLINIQAELERAATTPIEQLPAFRQQVYVSHLPTFVRRLCWHFVRTFPRLSGDAARGTFGVTSVSAWGVTSIHPPSLGYSVISYGPVSAEGRVRVTFVYDHRLFDGATIAGFLNELEGVFQDLIGKELMHLHSSVHVA